jgi:dTDP-4-dehydrorhamnose 3,5-epimerase
MTFHRLAIPEVILIEPRTIQDERGFFREIFKSAEFTAMGIHHFVQENHSRSTHRVLRGLHYQLLPQAQGKLVMVPQGKIFDVAVDIRRGSPTYGKWVGQELSETNGHMLFVPVGFAHGFCVMSEGADVIYKMTAEYAPLLERGIRWNDPELQIEWTVENPILSPKDSQLPLLRDAENNFVFE